MLGAGEVLGILPSLLAFATGLYLLAFRRPVAGSLLLGFSLVFGAADLPVPPGFFVFGALWLSTACLFVFFAVYPTRVRGASLLGAALLAAGAWCVASAAYMLTHPEVVVAQTPGPSISRILLPGSQGASIVVCSVALAAMRDLPSEDHKTRAARLLYLAATAPFVAGGGYVLAQALGGELGAWPLPTFLRPRATLGDAFFGASLWWILPGGIAAYSYARWRWRAPALLLAAGFLAGLVGSALAPAPETITYFTLRGWGTLAAPAMVLFAQARWRAFDGEPSGIASTVAITAFAALLAYAYAFVVALALAPTSALAYAVGPILGLAAAVAMGAFVLPRARRLELQRIFARGDEPAAAALGPGAVILGRYRVTRLLGEGAQGRAYEAVDRKSGEKVVLKATAGDEALREARILRELRHPNIVRFVDIQDESRGFSILVLAYAEGGTLGGLLARRGPLPVEEGAALVRGVLAGLAAAHARGFAHGDVKPDNVLLDEAGSPLLADFGSGRIAGSTLREGPLGTAGYIAPERLMGAPPSAQADVYAAGMLARQTLGDAVLPYAALVERATHREPDARFADAAAMLDAWEAAGKTLRADP